MAAASSFCPLNFDDENFGCEEPSAAAAASLHHDESLSSLLLSSDYIQPSHFAVVPMVAPKQFSKKRPRQDTSSSSEPVFNTLYHAFCQVLSDPSSTNQVQQFHSSSSMPNISVPFLSATFDSSMPYDFNLLSKKILSHSNHFAKPDEGATRGGDYRTLESKIPFLIRDLNYCALLGFSPRQIFEMYMAKNNNPDVKTKIFFK